MGEVQLFNVISEFYKSCVANTPKDERANSRNFKLIALCGVPGSGKTTTGKLTCEILNKQGLRSTCLSLDGYHIPLKDLSKERVYYRGAKDTFDLIKFKQDILKMRKTEFDTYSFPSFDHSVGDPKEDSIHVNLLEIDIIIVEGLYVLAPEVVEVFDFKCYLEGNLDVCMNRLKIRNQSIPGYTSDEIKIRVDEVDRKNGIYVEQLKTYADKYIKEFELK